MRFDVDLARLDAGGRVVRVGSGVGARRLRIGRAARAVAECLAGEASGLSVGTLLAEAWGVAELADL